MSPIALIIAVPTQQYSSQQGAYPQYSQYAAPQYQQPQQIIYTCIPVNVAVPASPADGTTTEWAGYSPAPISPTYVHDWNSQYPVLLYSGGGGA